MDIAKKDNDIDRKTDELFNLLSSSSDIKIPKYEGGIVFVGRAADIYGDKFAAGKGFHDNLCTAAPWWSDSDINGG